MPRLLLTLLFALCTCAAAHAQVTHGKPAAPSAASEQRLALVIGNSEYKDGPLPNPVNDARAIAKALATAGFKVIRKENAGQRELQAALREFGDALKAGGVGLFYYAGHGVQVKGRNYMIPVDARIEREDEIAYNSVDVGQVLDKMEAAGNRLNILILDACRNNPFARGSRAAAGGLAQMDAPVGTLIAFATAPGAVASDGTGKNGLYTQHLLQSMRKPGMKIEDVFKQVRTGVRRDSGGKQIPWESTSLEGDFVFMPEAPVMAKAGQAATKPAGKIERIETPELKIGDTWQFQVIDMISGSVKEKFTRNLSAVTADELRFGGRITDRSQNLLRQVSEGKTNLTWAPKRPIYDFPLQVGKSWSATGVLDNVTRTAEHLYTFNVVRQERVLVPAGVFDTLRVEGASKYKTRLKKDGAKGEGVSTHRYWFSPLTGHFVAYEFEETNWRNVVVIKERMELLSYKRVGH